MFIWVFIPRSNSNLLIYLSQKQPPIWPKEKNHISCYKLVYKERKKRANETKNMNSLTLIFHVNATHPKANDSNKIALVKSEQVKVNSVINSFILVCFQWVSEQMEGVEWGMVSGFSFLLFSFYILFTYL